MTFIEQQKIQFKQANIAVKLIYINVALFTITLLISSLFNLGGSQFNLLDYFVLKNEAWASLLKPWTLFTYSFFHSPSDVFHLISNMLFLYFFGQFFLNYFSEKMFLKVYFLGAIIGGLVFILLTNLLPVFQHRPSILIGASAAIYAVVACVIFYQPNMEVRLFGVFSIKLWYLAVFIFVMDLAQIASGNNIGGHLSHFGGALAGYFYLTQFNKGDKLGQFLNNIPNLFKKKPKLKKTKTPPRDNYEYNASKNRNQKEVDTILDKISKSGYASLTKAEKELLFKQGK